VLVDLGLTSFKNGDSDKAISFFEQALALAEAEPQHELLASVLMNLAVAKGVGGDMGESATLLERALAAQEEQLGPSHPDLRETLQNLIVVNTKLGQTEKAVAYMQRAGEIEDAVKKAAVSDKIDQLEGAEPKIVEVQK